MITTDAILYSGAPADIDVREEKEARVYHLLDSIGIEYIRTDHEKADTMEACNEIDRILDVLICKNLFLCNRQKTSFYLLMMPGKTTFKTKELSAQISSARLSFASPNDMERLLNIKPGAVSIMGLMNDHNNEVSLLIDRTILDCDYIGCHPCVSTSSLKIKTTDIVNKFLPAIKHSYQIVSLTGK